MDETTVSRFMNLFHGRKDAYGSEEGGCVKQPVTQELFMRHFRGEEPIGIYPMFLNKGEWECSWGCSDIDIEDYGMAVDLSDALAAAGVHAHIERSRSKGYHVWVFTYKTVPAKDMRRMFLAAHQVADIPPREVNPKQEFLKPDQYGNYVRLPYANFLNEPDDTHRRILVDYDTAMPIQEFIDLATEVWSPPDLIQRLAGFYRPPTPTHSINTSYTPCTGLDEAMRVLSPLGKVIWRDGPLQGRDRSSTLAKLGHECVRSGMNPSQTKVVLMDADVRWGKYHLRANGEMEIDKLVQRVYGR